MLFTIDIERNLKKKKKRETLGHPNFETQTRLFSLLTGSSANIECLEPEGLRKTVKILAEKQGVLQVVHCKLKPIIILFLH